MKPETRIVHRDAPVIYDASAGFDRSSLTQDPYGNIHSPWFSFPTVEHRILHPNDLLPLLNQACRAFADTLNIQPDHLTVNSLLDNESGDTRFKLITRDPFPMPAKARRESTNGAIDV